MIQTQNLSVCRAHAQNIASSVVSLRGYRPLLAGSSAGIVRRRRLLTPGDGVEAEQDQQHGVGLIPRSVAERAGWS